MTPRSFPVSCPLLWLLLLHTHTLYIYHWVRLVVFLHTCVSGCPLGIRNFPSLSIHWLSVALPLARGPHVITPSYMDSHISCTLCLDYSLSLTVFGRNSYFYSQHYLQLSAETFSLESGGGKKCTQCQVYNPCIQDAEAGGWHAWSQPGLHGKTLSHKTKTKQKMDTRHLVFSTFFFFPHWHF